jgi:YcxB-like protein
VDFALTPDDLGSFAAFTCAGLRSRQRLFFICAGSMMMLPVLILVTGRPNGSDEFDVFVIEELLMVVLFGLLYIFRATIDYWWARWRFRSARFAGYLGPARIALSEEGLRWKGSAGELASPWSAIVNVTTTPVGLYLYYTSVSALIVPRRAFENDSAFRNFAEMAAALREAALGEVSAQGRAA